MLRQEKGITLVALIITIIVLVILAAVAITTAYQTGIVNYAMNGATGYAQAGLNENRMMNNSINHLDSYMVSLFSIFSTGVTAGS